MRFVRILFYGSIIAVIVGIKLFMDHKKEIVRGNGEKVVTERTLDEFDQIYISGGFKVVLEQGDKSLVRINGDENLIDQISTEVHNRKLKLKYHRKIQSPESVTLHVQSKDYRRIQVAGAVDLSTDGRLALEELELKVSGAGKVKMDLEAEALAMGLSGAGYMQVVGEAEKARMSISGAGEIKAYDLVTEELFISISGAGSANVHATENLEVHASGAASVRYKGAPKISQSVSGAASIRSVK